MYLSSYLLVVSVVVVVVVVVLVVFRGSADNLPSCISREAEEREAGNSQAGSLSHIASPSGAVSKGVELLLPELWP